MSDGRTNTATAKTGNWACPRERDETRATILAAAKQLLEREGAEAVTLSAVAKQAQVTRPVIYSFFSSRQELLTALEQPPEAAAEERETGSAGPQPEGGSETPDADQGYDELMRAQAEALQELSQQVIVPKSHQRDAALARMEARLAVTEQSFSALEQRVGEKLKTVDSETNALSAGFKGLRERIEKFEDRQQTALAQLRLDIHNLKNGELETAAIREPAVELPAEPMVLPVAPDVVEPGRPPQGYLHSARQAAIAAAQIAAARPPRHRSPYQRLLFRHRWLLIALAAFLVVWFDVYVFAHYQPAQGSVPAAAQAIGVSKTVRLSPQDQLARGLKYLNGSGVAVNVEKAARLLQRAASRGQPVAQNFVGVLYQTGTGVRGDMATAVRWYEAAAAQGNLKAMTNLGKLYAGGWKNGTDFVKAAHWFGKAAAFGDVDAQFDLAVLYERGEGVLRNAGEAYKWYAVAGASGDLHAAERASILEAQLDPDEIAEAKASAAVFKPLPVDRAANDAPSR